MSALERLDRLAQRAETISGAWGARARGSTSSGQERAILRLFGVHGLDRAGQPLAGRVVERYIGRSPERLAAGVALPFAMALVEYDVTPQQLALDVASGAVDLELERSLLRELDRRAVAEAEARRLASTALTRIDANRTARRELLDVLGEPPRPWLGTTVSEPAVERALSRALERVGEGFDLLRVEVPVGRELADRLLDAGVDLPGWPSTGGDSWIDDDRESSEHAPAGSQRGLGRLRHLLDEVAAGRRGYVRLATAAPALAAPEQAAVAAFERIDVVQADALAEIVATSVDPDRAVADHAFAHRLLARSGAQLLLGAGPLAVAPDLVSGRPSSPAIRAGRALALQLLGATLAVGDGLPAGQVIVGALPVWLSGEPTAAARGVAEVTLRRLLLPDHPVAFEEPPPSPIGDVRWPFILAAVAPPPPQTALVLRQPRQTQMAGLAAAGRAATEVGAQVARAWSGQQLTGDARTHAQATVDAAIRTLERLEDQGWRSVLGEPPDGGEQLRLGGDALAERTESFDPFSPA